MSSFLLLNGPNLNLLGSREPEKYGKHTLVDIENKLTRFLATENVQLESFQSNAEHELIDKIHWAKTKDINFILINPAAFTHTSVALRDALLSVSIPFIEVHLTNPHKREPFRHTSYFSDIAEAVIAGFGAQGYQHAAQLAVQLINEQNQNEN